MSGKFLKSLAENVLTTLKHIFNLFSKCPHPSKYVWIGSRELARKANRCFSNCCENRRDCNNYVQETYLWFCHAARKNSLCPVALKNLSGKGACGLCCSKIICPPRQKLSTKVPCWQSTFAHKWQRVQ